MTEHESKLDEFCIERLLERVELVHSAASNSKWKKEEDELADMVENLHEHMESVANRYTEAKARIDRYISVDTQRSENVKRKHEELSEEFHENFSSLVEPRSFIWRTIDKVGFYITLILSFVLVVPLTACYSKTLRFIRTRRRRFSNSRRRPAWTTGHGEVEPDFVPSDFFGEGGLAHMAVSRFSSGSVASLPVQNEEKHDRNLSRVSVHAKIPEAKTITSEQKSSDSSPSSDPNSASAINTLNENKVVNGFNNINSRRLRHTLDVGEKRVVPETLREKVETNPIRRPQKTKRDNDGWMQLDSEGWQESSNSTDFWLAFRDTGE